MSTIKINELATSSISLTDFFAKADASGIASKSTIQELSNFLSTTETLGFKGVLLSTDATVTEDGIYLAGDAGTYTNNGGLVITVNDKIVLISITGTQTVFEKAEFPITLTIDAVPTTGSTDAVQSGGVADAIDAETTARNLALEDKTTMALDSNEVLFPNTGYYTTLGVFVPSNSFLNTGIFTLKDFLLIKANSVGDGSLANIVYFNSSDVFVGYKKYTSNTVEVVSDSPPTATKAVVTKSATSTFQTKVYNSLDADKLTVLDKFINIQTSLDETDNFTKIITTDNLAFSENGYYNLVGTLNPLAGWSSTPITPIVEAILIKGKSQGDASVANIVFFTSANAVVSSRKFTTDTFMYFKDLDPIITKFAVTKTDSDSTSFVRTGTMQTILESYINIYKLSLTDKQPVYNYFPNYNLQTLDYSLATNVDSLGVSSAVNLQTDETFTSLGFKSSLQIVKTSTSNTVLFTMGKNNIPASFLVNKKLNISFFINSSITTTLTLEIYRSNPSTFSSVKLFSIPVVANVVKKVDLVADLSVEDISIWNYFHLFFINLATGTYKITGLKIWDGNIPKELNTNMLSKSDMQFILQSENPYFNAKGLFIGDSISTSDTYFWKGYLSKYYNINYLSDTAGTFASAVGGKALFPPVTENPANYSIWFLCGNQRLTDRTPDFINLFGGTNDLNSIADLGTRTDTPYLDTDGSRPVGLTWSSAFKGCIEMLQRDFPNVEIIINTVLDTEYGTDIYVGSFSKSYIMAVRQMQIAQDYGLKVVPFYFCGITLLNNRLFTSDGIHPNKSGATLLTDTYAQTLFLK